ncbi:hypothetical protein C4B68_03435 [Streptomyces dengpaensis]|uniref:Peptidase inhibitor family I36 protein n=1 Tax=Streptomyces dengpaensis TaxID=2049881 RepID=A0ABN5ICY7_9ACTN|nr:hypothetical protein C4B68_03435 [Streptomyces dengpaensis]PIB08444.1 hypothetical protein B1C81_15420 [Streptomyces sp. HG99]
MFRGFAVPAAALAAALPGAAPAPATAVGAPLAGDVCFWTAAGQHGSSWCYTPPGYTDVPDFLQDKAASFRTNADTAVYAIEWGRDTCHHRLIRTHDLADNWPWGARLDGVADTTMGCEVG